MAILCGHKPVVGPVTDVHTTAKNTVGERAVDEAGNEYIYLKGVASTAIGTWVSFDETGTTTRLVTNAQGRVAIAMAATVASTWGWYQIYGMASGLALTLFADNGKVYITATDGSVDDADVATNLVNGAVGRSAVNETTLLATFELNYPEVLDVAMD
jgi:hypothetical protein